MVAHGHGESVSGVRGLRRRVEAELDAHHLLHLRLVAAAVPRHRQLHLGRRVRPHRQPDGGGRQQRNRPRLADRKGGAGVLADERVLDGDLRRLPALDDAGQLAEDVVQALLRRAFAPRGDGAARERFEPVALRADDAPARDAQPRVDAEYDESVGWCRNVPPCSAATARGRSFAVTLSDSNAVILSAAKNLTSLPASTLGHAETLRSP